MTITQIACNTGNYGGSRKASAIKYIVIHYTANDGDTAVANGNYFANNVVKASAHYFVDDTTIVQSVPDLRTAWSVGGKKYANCSTTGGGTYYGKCTNSNSLSIELCGTGEGMKASAKTIALAGQLVRSLMQKYSISESNVIRHFDVTGKPCPAWATGSGDWKTLKSALLASSSTTTATSTATTASSAHSVLQKGSTGSEVKVLQKALNARGYSLAVDGSFGSATLSAVRLYQAHNGLTVDGSVGPKTWASLDADTASYRVTATSLCVRTGPGTNYVTKEVIRKGNLYNAVSASDGWAKLERGGYSSLTYLQKV